MPGPRSVPPAHRCRRECPAAGAARAAPAGGGGRAEVPDHVDDAVDAAEGVVDGESTVGADADDRRCSAPHAHGTGLSVDDCGSGVATREDGEERRLVAFTEVTLTATAATPSTGIPTHPGDLHRHGLLGPIGVRRPSDTVTGVADPHRRHRDEVAGRAVRPARCRILRWHDDRRRRGRSSGHTGPSANSARSWTCAPSTVEPPSAEPAVDDAAVVVAEVDVVRHPVPAAESRPATAAATESTTHVGAEHEVRGRRRHGRCRHRRCSNWSARTPRTS